MKIGEGGISVDEKKLEEEDRMKKRWRKGYIGELRKKEKNDYNSEERGEGGISMGAKKLEVVDIMKEV